MGYKCAWVAVRGTTVEQLLADVDHELTGESADFCESGMYLAKADHDWLLIIGKGSQCVDEVTQKDARVLSSACETLYFTCIDGDMTTQLIAFAHGRQTWSIVYNGIDGPAEPELEGDLPAIVTEILRAARKEQAADDDECDFVYDVTANVAKALTGFRHDEDHEVHELRPR